MNETLRAHERDLAIAVIMMAMYDYATAQLITRKFKSTSSRKAAQQTINTLDQWFRSPVCAYWQDLAGLAGTDIRAIVAADPVGVKSKIEKSQIFD